MRITFDTETTGLPKKGAKYRDDYSLFPYIVQLSWKRSDNKHVKDYIIKPQGYDIPEDVTKIHGITTEKAKKEGVEFEVVVLMFLIDCLCADRIVGHNIYFDTSNIKANIFKSIEKKRIHSDAEFWAESALDKSKRIDTMIESISFCNIPFPNGKGQKWPRLEELYLTLFNKSFDAHNSKNDVLATEECYLELIKRNIIT